MGGTIRFLQKPDFDSFHGVTGTMLTGEKKKEYQREYMRRYRSNKRKTQTLDPVRPETREYLEGLQVHCPSIMSDGRVCDIYDKKGNPVEPEPQSDNPMMVGYVPPVE